MAHQVRNLGALVVDDFVRHLGISVQPLFGGPNVAASIEPQPAADALVGAFSDLSRVWAGRARSRKPSA